MDYSYMIEISFYYLKHSYAALVITSKRMCDLVSRHADIICIDKLRNCEIIPCTTQRVYDKVHTVEFVELEYGYNLGVAVQSFPNLTSIIFHSGAVNCLQKIPKNVTSIDGIISDSSIGRLKFPRHINYVTLMCNDINLYDIPSHVTVSINKPIDKYLIKHGSRSIPSNVKNIKLFMLSYDLTYSSLIKLKIMSAFVVPTMYLPITLQKLECKQLRGDLSLLVNLKTIKCHIFDGASLPININKLVIESELHGDLSVTSIQKMRLPKINRKIKLPHTVTDLSVKCMRYIPILPYLKKLRFVVGKNGLAYKELPNTLTSLDVKIGMTEKIIKMLPVSITSLRIYEMKCDYNIIRDHLVNLKYISMIK